MNLDKISVVILAAGLGTRLTNFRGGKTNKLLLEINGIPMILKQIYQLIGWGFNRENIICVTNQNINNAIEEAVSGEFGSDIKYVIQPEPLGISHAFSFSEPLISSDHVLLALGDNFFELNPFLDTKLDDKVMANIFTKKVNNPQDFGIIELSGERIISIEEKPANPVSDLAVVGLYLYKKDIFKNIKMLTPSDRGEYEITDLNRGLIKKGDIVSHEIDGWWIDAGTPERIIELEEKLN